MGDVIGDINSRRGSIVELSDRMGMKSVESLVPLANMFQVFACTICSANEVLENPRASSLFLAVRLHRSIRGDAGRGSSRSPFAMRTSVGRRRSQS